jgi:Leucine-rich repeat (LRR) protein
LGQEFSNLIELRLNNSIIKSLRDIGTSLKNLKFLWVSRCQISDISGITSFPKLVELYANYNFINDLTPLYYNDSLEILDLEGNDISKIDNIEILETVSKLSVLNL